jgi:Bacteriophage HK97-gp10, putative tail-component
MNIIFSIDGVPELNAHLDTVATAVANPIARDALQAGGAVVQAAARETVHRLTGALAEDIVVVTRVRSDGAEKYVLIGPGWSPDAYRRTAGNRKAGNRLASPDQTTNPGLYGYFLEEGHRAPGEGLSHNLQFKADSASAKRRGQKVNTHDYGHLSTPAYPWLEPAFNSTEEEAMQVIADTINDRMGALGL